MNWGILGALFITGLAGRLHCVGMCGPILLGLTPQRSQKSSWGYHLGRLWTYALLGLIVGSVGQRLESFWQGQRLFAIVLGSLVILAGLLLLRRGNSAPERWLAAKLGATVRGLNLQGGFGSRVAVGAIMGLSPCGLVWMALVPAAALGDPLLSALGMIAFGLGTVPALTSVVLLNRLMANRLRKHGRTIAAVTLILAGMVLFFRAAPLQEQNAPACHDDAVVASTAGDPEGTQ